MITATNEDNMIMMARYPDDYFDLAIVDPPYGIGEDGAKNHSRVSKAKPTLYASKNWDKKPTDVCFFTELKRVSKNQIIFGANHFISKIPFDSSCWIVWDKDNTGDFADSELAYTSFKSAVRNFKFRWNGMLQQNMKNKEVRIHPTQKPVKLYEWLLMNYAKEGNKILDTHRGSASLDIACHNLGFDLVTCELDTDYFNDGNKRLKQHQQQLIMF